MGSVEVLLINALLYTIALIYFYKKYDLSVGVIIWALYTVSAWSSFLFIQQPGYVGTVHDTPQTMLPCLYLYVIFLISMKPLMKLYTINRVSLSIGQIARYMIIVLILIQTVFIIVDIPTVVRNMSTNTMMLNELRSSIYGDEGVSLVTQNPLLNKFFLLFSGMRILATGLSVVLFFTNTDNRRLVNTFAVVTLLNNLRQIIVQVGRGEMVLVFLLYACMVYLLKDQISKKTKRRLFLISIPIVIAGGLFFWAISVSRFGSKAGFFIFKYLGEPMNNFNGILFKEIKGTTNGRAYFSLIYRYLFGESKFISANDKWDLIKSATGIRGDIFYTWVGGLIIEFGKVAPFIVAIFLNRISKRLISVREYFVGDIIVLIFFLNFFLRGVFLFPTQNFEGMLMIIYTVLLYFAFRVQKRNGTWVYVLPRRRRK